MSAEIDVVEAWQEAANEQDREKLQQLSAPDIVLVGPRGRAQGTEVLEGWLERANLTMRTLRIYQRGDTVVLHQHGVWGSVATGEEASHASFATRFRVHGGRVAELERYADLEAALAATGFSAEDEVAI